MSEKNSPAYEAIVKELMGKKSHILSKAQAFAEIGMLETAQPLFSSAAGYEERIAALLDTKGQELEAAVYRISAASCYEQAGNLSNAVNLYRAALAGPLKEKTRTDVLAMLNLTLKKLAHQQPFIATATPVPETLAAV